MRCFAQSVADSCSLCAVVGFFWRSNSWVWLGSGKVLVFDLDLIRISCVHGIDSPTMKFVRRLMICPVGVGFIFIIWAFRKCRGQKMHFDKVFNVCGIFTFALFITIALTVVDPLQCGRNPDGSQSMLSNPGVICFDSSEHFVMLTLSIIGIICYPVTIIAWATYTTCKYPSRITSGVGWKQLNPGE